jgi:hypothetical protein
MIIDILQFLFILFPVERSRHRRLFPLLTYLNSFQLLNNHSTSTSIRVFLPIKHTVVPFSCHLSIQLTWSFILQILLYLICHMEMWDFVFKNIRSLRVWSMTYASFIQCYVYEKDMILNCWMK